MFKAGIIAALGLSISAAAYAADRGAPAYEPFPNGYGYMDANEITKLLNAWQDGSNKPGNQAIIRDHGWRLWAGIMQQASSTNWPLWFTWPNSTAAFLPAAPAGLGAALAEGKPTSSMLQRNMLNNTNPVHVDGPFYPIPEPVAKQYPNAVNNCTKDPKDPKNPEEHPNICDGAHFQFNGDILIATESLSQEGFDWIRGNRLYLGAVLDSAHTAGEHQLLAPQQHVVTKHMFWPVKAGQITALPVWRSDDFNEDNPGYAGYEKWRDLIAIDPTGQNVGKTMQVSYLYGLYQPDEKTPPPPLDKRKPWPTVSASAKVYGLKDFYYHKVTADDWASFDEADKAILNAASYWTYNQPFGAGDYLVTVAMHINTKEIPTWTMQSVWWSDQPNAGPYAQNRPQLPQAKGPWDHYLLVDAYGSPVQDPPVSQPVATNPYIELASHPIATNCNNCHNRAGWPKGPDPDQSSYQSSDCPDLLATLSTQSPCLAKLTLTDFQWIITDRAIVAKPK
jgi:hypothetical protein